MNMPFTKEYVIRCTLDKWTECTNYSLNKTISRLEEFQDDPVKTKEIQDALHSLYLLNSLVQNIKLENNLDHIKITSKDN